MKHVWTTAHLLVVRIRADPSMFTARHGVSDAQGVPTRLLPRQRRLYLHDMEIRPKAVAEASALRPPEDLVAFCDPRDGECP